MKNFILLLSTLLTVSGIMHNVAKAQFSVVDNGKSTFTIVIPAEAPTSVQNAAMELQGDIKLSTGVELPVQKDSSIIRNPFISLGLTKQAIAAKLNTSNMKDEEFHILTKGNDLYIWGVDTPNGKWTKLGGVSNGTANGVYRFLEYYLDVRWLMPGKIGRDVPHKSTFALDKIDRKGAPNFIWRNMPHIDRGKHENLPQPYLDIVQRWAAHQGVGTYGVNNSVMKYGNSDFNHNWTKTVPAKLYKEYPDWFAMRNGKRVKPTGRYKLETTNSELVHYYAEKAIQTLKARQKAGKRMGTYSLSPSDSSSNWSESPESKALYDPPLPGSNRQVVSSLILKFYHDVAKIVEKEYPQGRLSGYIYSNYLYPPTKVAMTFPDNFTPVIAPSIDYGYKLYQKDVQKKFQSIMAAWAKVAPKNWFYYDLPNQLYVDDASGEQSYTGNTANITPAAPEILNLIFHQMVKSRIRGALIYADPAWSNSALANYITAKMMWNPELDANMLQREWLQRAYGLSAGQKMEIFYNRLDSIFRDYYRKNRSAGYHLNQAMLRNLYATHYGELEHLFLQAKLQPMTDIQRKRLQMIEDNLVVLQWRLRNVGFLSTEFSSPLQRTDAQVADIIEEKHSDIDYFPGIIPHNLPLIKIKNVKLERAILPSKTSPYALPNDHTFLIYVTKNSTVQIIPERVKHNTTFVAYALEEYKQGTISSGILVKNRPIKFKAKAGQYYILHLTNREGTEYQLSIDDGVQAKGLFDIKKGTLSIQNAGTAVYVYGAKGKVYGAEHKVVFGTGAGLEGLKNWIQTNTSANLLKNGNFEDTSKNTDVPSEADWSTEGTVKDWYTWTGGKGTQFLKTEGREGNGFRIKNDKTGDNGIINQTVPVKPGSTYLGIVWVKSTNNKPGAHVEFSLRFRKDGNWFNGDTRVRTSAFPTNQWERVFVLAAVPKGVNGITFMLGSKASDVTFDGAALYEVPENIAAGS